MEERDARDARGPGPRDVDLRDLDPRNIGPRDTGSSNNMQREMRPRHTDILNNAVIINDSRGGYDNRGDYRGGYGG